MSKFSPRIDAQTLSSWLTEGRKVTLIDCRFSLSDPRQGFRDYSVGHLPAAVYADLERDLSAPIVPGVSGRHPLPDVNTLARKLGSWGVSSSTPVVAYDDGSHMFAPRLWWLLTYFGHRQVAVLEGGVRSWLVAGQSLTPKPAQPKATDFRPTIVKGLRASVSEVERISDGKDPRKLLLDARAERRFFGLEEPLDPVAGHIPNAVNLPFTRLIGPDGPLPPDQIRHHLKAAVGERSPDAVIAYCGSGVTACAVIWAAATAGVDGMRLYPGSWSEWLANPAHRVD